MERIRRTCRGLGLALLLSATALLLVRYRVHAVPAAGMSPLIGPGDRIVVDTWTHDAVRGDVVLVGDRAARVAATAGSFVSCCDAAGRILVDGLPMNAGHGAFTVKVPRDRLFLLGDDPAVLLDSREVAAAGDGTVAAGEVRGRVIAVIGSGSRASTLPDPAVRTLVWTSRVAAAGLALILLAALPVWRRNRASCH
ncbi:S26 family signal peptidase [Actinoplanes rectilineatus]